MTAAAAACILDALADRRTVEPRVMIVVAHPDDETISMGAQLCRFRDALLMQLTDGAPRDGRDAAAHGYATLADYASARSAELYSALAAGQAGGVRTTAIGIPDQEACFNLIALTDSIARRLRAEMPEAIFVLPYEGGHPDHDAASFAVWAARRLIEAEGKSPPAAIEMASYHAVGPGLETGAFLPSSRPVTTLALNSTDRSRKRRMIDCFVSQRDLLAGFGIDVERFRKAPDYDYARPPHPGELHYENLGWRVSGELWRRHTKAALETLGLRAP